MRARGRPGPFTPVDLAVAAGRPLLLRQPFEGTAFDEVILGCAAPVSEEMNPGRVAALRLGLGHRMPGWTVQRNCGSGMQSVETAWRYIADGRADLILAGGTESLSHTPLQFNRHMVDWLADLAQAKSATARLKVLARFRPHFLKPVISLERGLTDPTVQMNMGQTAEVLADRFNISREAADAYAVRSHQRLSRATAEGFLVEMEPIFDDRGNLYDHDDGVRPDSTVERLGRLRPVFEPPWGKVTAGNSSQITDGAAWLILASESAVNRYGLEPLGRISGSQWSALDPAQMGLGPAHASAALMQRYRLGVGDIDAWELNEAFAAQVLACLKVWKDDAYCRDQLGLEGALGEIDPERLNVDGGAISLGHPVGTSGARITLHLLHVLRRLGGRRGIATLCIGGGQGGALLVERP
ncbi:MAG: acetyl-CoA C-acetyltransferase [Alphaproteobacteria bacterium]